MVDEYRTQLQQQQPVTEFSALEGELQAMSVAREQSVRVGEQLQLAVAEREAEIRRLTQQLAGNFIIYAGVLKLCLLHFPQ